MKWLIFATAFSLSCVLQAHAGPKNVPDQCNASEFAYFVGKSVSALAERRMPGARFVCQEDCLSTADLVGWRLTVIYSKRTKRITRVSCG
jgi:hypothetical protein